MARDIILREVPSRGWLPIIVNQETGKEEYRGEFRDTTGIALEHAERALDELEIHDAQSRNTGYKVQEKLDGMRCVYDSQNIPEGKGDSSGS